MNCKICGSSDFCTTSGITYCTECNSQIEETQTETDVNFVPSKDILSSSSIKVESTTKGRQEYTDWITIECYQSILADQVAALINLGASLKIRETVFFIWTKYLKECEIAFCDPVIANDKPRLGPVPSKRDIQILYGDRKIKRNCKKKCGKTSPVVTSGEDSSDSDLVISDSDSSASSVSSSSSNFNLPRYSSHAKKLYRKRRLKSDSRRIYCKLVTNMTMPKTIVICYLGLLYTEDQLSLSDLIRFIYEGKIPYLNIKNSSSMGDLFQSTDCSTFTRYSVPEAHEILKMTHTMVKFLNLPKFKEPSVFLAVSRFIKDFNLPDDLKPIISMLIKSFEEKMTKYNCRTNFDDEPYDYQALAFILVALKILFVLDDKYEIEHSETMVKLNAIHPDKKFFVWKEWKEQSMIKEYLFMTEISRFHTVNKLDSLSADNIISKYEFTESKHPKSILNYRLAVIASKCAIKDGLEEIVSISKGNNSGASSFPLRAQMESLMANWRNLQLFSETSKIDFTLLKKDFTSCSLNFRPMQFNEVDDELSHILMNSLYVSETLVNNNFFTTKFNQIPSTSIHQTIQTSSKYWFCRIIGSGNSRYSLDDFNKLPASFRWLANFMSKHVYCGYNHLYNNVVVIEKVLFLQSINLSTQQLSKLKNKVIVKF